MWYLLHFCFSLVTMVNPFFRPVLPLHQIKAYRAVLLSNYTTKFEILRIVWFFTTSKPEHYNNLWGPFWKLKVRGNLFVCLQIWTVATLTYEKQNCVCECFISKYIFFSYGDFSTITPYFVYPISNMSCSFSLKLNVANRRPMFFSWALNKRKTNCALTCSFQKVIRILALRGRKKFNISFQHSWYRWGSFKNYNLICETMYS